jgi:hypothetical protein
MRAPSSVTNVAIGSSFHCGCAALGCVGRFDLSDGGRDWASCSLTWRECQLFVKAALDIRYKRRPLSAVDLAAALGAHSRAPSTSARPRSAAARSRPRTPASPLRWFVVSAAQKKRVTISSRFDTVPFRAVPRFPDAAVHRRFLLPASRGTVPLKEVRPQNLWVNQRAGSDLRA